MAAPDGAGGWRTLGRVGSGLAGALAADLTRRLVPLTRPDCPYAQVPDDPDTRRTTWVEPVVLIDVRYLGFDESGRLRQPVLRGVRTDLDVADLLAGAATPAGDGL
jgi:bifunctional non-homologous end joining protein LigD